MTTFAAPTFLAAFSLAIAYTVGLCIHRLYFHPLAKFPGPKLNAISPIPAIRMLLRGRMPLEVKQLHDQYGSVVRVAPNELSYSSAQAWEDIYGFRPGHQNFRKDPTHVTSIAPLPNGMSLTQTNDADHTRQRRALSHPFSSKALEEQEHIVQGYVDLLVKKMGEMGEREEVINMVDWFNYMTFDTIGDLAFGEPFGCMKEGRFHEWVALVFDTIKASAFEQATRRFASPGTLLNKLLLKFIPAEVKQRRIQHLMSSQEKVRRRIANEKTEQKDFFYYILRQKDRFSLHEDEMVVNGALMIIAGSETTASALSSTLARLFRDPARMEKVVKEVRDNIKTKDDCTNEKWESLPYLNACIEEGLRVMPPVPIGLLRTVPSGGDTIDGTYVPGGTSVAVTSYAAGHNPTNFRQPDEFIPERWLDDAYSSDNKLGARPFSLGPRGCIGKNLANLEMRAVLGSILWNFDFESTDGTWMWNPDNELEHMRAFLTWVKPQLNVKVRPVVRA